MNPTVLPQLQTIEAELASQESQLAAQLASVQEKLSGIRTVMPMFLERADSAARLVAKELPSVNELVAKDAATLSEAPEEASTMEQSAVPTAPESAFKPIETEAIKTTKATKATEPKKTAQKKATAQKKTTAKKASAEETDGRTAAWQMYTRPGVKNESIPDAVRLILATQPENDFRVADVMEALFQAEMPESQYLKARNRISNVLSGGVRAGDWHEGDRGTYRMTAA